MQYRREIDGLRALAVLPVLFFHAGIRPFSGGFIGVDVFFVISGYLITALALEEKRDGRFSLWRFYERRARRILPALLFVALVCIPLANAFLFPADLKEFSQSLIATLLFVSNVYFWRQAGYFEPQDELRPLLHTWSLAVEEQFYILFPLLLLLLWWRFRAALPWVLAAGALASLAFAEWGSSAKPLFTFYLLPTRAWELLAGALLACAHLAGHLRQLTPAIKETASAVGLGLIIYAVFAFEVTDAPPNLRTLIPVVGTVIILACADAGTLVGRVLSNRLLVGIGLVSYSAYLWHQPLFAFARHRSLTALSTLDLLGLIALTLALAHATWRFVEVPLRRKQDVATPHFVTVAVSFSVLCLAAAYQGYLSNGAGFRSTDWVARTKAIEARFHANYAVDGVCDATFLSVAKCVNDPELLLWGDSNAKQLVPAFFFSRPGLKIAQLTIPSCGPILGLAPFDRQFGKQWSAECIRFNDRAMAFVRSHPSLKYAVLSSALLQYLGDNAQVMTREGELKRGGETALPHLLKTIDELKSIGITPVLFSPVPQPGFDMGRCLMRVTVWGGNTDVCDFDGARSERNQAPVLAFLKKLQEAGVKVILLSDMLCEAGRCATTLEGIPLYRDFAHLSEEGSAAAGRRWDFYRLIQN